MWYPLHFLTIPLGYLTVFFVAFFSRRLSPRARTWAVRAFVILLYISEIVKQITVRDSYSPNYLLFRLPCLLSGVTGSGITARVPPTSAGCSCL